MAERCIAYHLETGDRCPRRVSRRASVSPLKLCAKHGRNPLVVMQAWYMNVAERVKLARHPWIRIECGEVSDIQTVAQRYLDHGWSVVPLVKGQKRASDSRHVSSCSIWSTCQSGFTMSPCRNGWLQRAPPVYW